MTHELFHCYQAQIMGVGPWTSAVNAHPVNVNGANWLIKGSAEWVGECSVGDCITQGSSLSGKWWDMYLASPQTPLFEHGYDGVGFFAHMQESGISVFERLPYMLTAGSDADSFAAAQVDDKFLATWAGGYARVSSRGPGVWDTTGPGVTATRPAINSTQVDNGTNVTDDIDAYSNALASYTLNADIVAIGVGFDGHGQLHQDDGTTLDGPALNASFCIRPAGCQLPSPATTVDRLWGTSRPGPPRSR